MHPGRLNYSFRAAQRAAHPHALSLLKRNHTRSPHIAQRPLSCILEWCADMLRCTRQSNIEVVPHIPTHPAPFTDVRNRVPQMGTQITLGGTRLRSTHQAFTINGLHERLQV